MSNQLQNKFIGYEVEPPLKVWQEISDALDEALPKTVTEKLYHFRQKPPDSTWDKIKIGLTKEKEQARVIPFFTRYRKPLKYSGAIAAFIVFGILTSLLISKKTISETTVPFAEQKSFTGKKNESGPFATVEKDNRSREINSAAAQVHLYSLPRKRSVFRYASLLSPSSSGTFAGITAVRKDIPYNNLYDKYMVVDDDAGNVFRLPKKCMTLLSAQQMIIPAMKK